MEQHDTPARQLAERRAPIVDPLGDRFALDAITVRRTPRLARLLTPPPVITSEAGTVQR